MNHVNGKIVCLQIVILMLFIHGCAHYQGKPSDHFDGVRFFGTEPDNAFSDHVKWLWQMKTVDWPNWIDEPQKMPPSLHTNAGELWITYINQSTVLLQMDGVTILTDPIWSKKAGPFSWAGAPRIRNPGIRIEDLPPIDIVLISHDHYDHLDLPTINQVVEKHHPVFLVGLGVKKRLEDIKRIRVIELDWWQSYDFQKDRQISFVPARHSSGRSVFDGNKTLWGGFVIEGLSGNVLFMGDTASGDCFREIQKKYSPFRLAVLPIGSYEKRWFMQSQHMNPSDAVKVHKQLMVKQSVGIHFATFTEHPEMAIDAHEKDLQDALKANRVAESEFWILGFGESREVP